MPPTFNPVIRVKAGLLNAARIGAARLIVVLSLSSCSAGGGSGGNAAPAARADIGSLPPLISNASIPALPATSTTPAASATAAPQAVPVELHYVLPSKFVAPSNANRSPSGAIRALKYISPSNTQISIAVTPFGGSTTTFGPTTCTASSCTIAFTATPGPNTIAFTLTDGTNILSTFSATTIVQATALNTLNFTTNPVVSSVGLSLQSPSLPAGAEGDDLVTVNALDAAGNTIIGKGNYVDLNGNPISFSLNVTNAQAGGRGNVRIRGPLRVTAPGQAAIYAHYDGKWLDRSTISVVGSTNPAISAQATLTSTPTTTEYSFIQNTGSHTMTSGSPAAIIPGSDGNLWSTENDFPNGHCVLKISPAGIIVEYCNNITNPGAVFYETLGADGNVWFSEYSANKIGHISPSGAVTEFAAGSAAPTGITTSSDGAIWFVNQLNSAGRIDPSGAAKTFPVTTGSQLSNIAAGPDGNLWITSKGSAIIARLTQKGVETDFPYADTCVSTDVGIVSGSDGNLWFVRCDAVSIGRITPSGVITPFTIGITGNTINSLTKGPDGNIWFVEAGSNIVAKITTSGLVTEYPSVTSGASYGIALGSDGNIWYTNLQTNKIAKFIL